MIYSSNRRTYPISSIIIGLILIGAGLFWGKITYDKMKDLEEKEKTYVETTSRVVGHKQNNDGQQAIIVEYTVDGVKYKDESDKYKDEYVEIGTAVKVKYDSTNPERIIWEENNNDNIIFLIISGVVVFFGLCSVVNGISNCFKKQVVVPIRPLDENRELNDHEKYQLELQQRKNKGE